MTDCKSTRNVQAFDGGNKANLFAQFIRHIISGLVQSQSGVTIRYLIGISSTSLIIGYRLFLKTNHGSGDNFINDSRPEEIILAPGGLRQESCKKACTVEGK
uniref:Uncharacterized protein n=1 Tax=Glossina austeni TaxID=7395 RepID=A0A1A9UEM5_GLOAU